MGVDSTGVMQFGATNNNTIFPALDNMDKLVRIILLRRPLGAMSFWISHGTGKHQVIGLHHGQVLLETVVVIRAMSLKDSASPVYVDVKISTSSS